MKKLLFFIVMAMLLAATLDVNSATLKDGPYINEFGDICWIVSGDTIRVYDRETRDYVLTTCKIKADRDNIIKVNSILNPTTYDVITKSEVGDTIIAGEDSIYVEFVTDITIIPPGSYYVNMSPTPLLAPEPTCRHKCHEVKDKEVKYGVSGFLIPKIYKNGNNMIGDIFITPPSYEENMGHDIYYGMLYLHLSWIDLGKHNYVRILLPYLNQYEFWRRYYFFGEYIHVTKDGFEWRNEVFKRKSKRPNWMEKGWIDPAY